MLPIRNTSFSVIGLCTAIITLEKVTPVMIGTFSFSISFCTICVATSGLSWLSSRSTCTGTPPSLPPLRSTTIMKASYWSWPERALRAGQLGHEADLDRRLGHGQGGGAAQGKGGDKTGLACGHGAMSFEQERMKLV